jgi:hypothetical protein
MELELPEFDINLLKKPIKILFLGDNTDLLIDFFGQNVIPGFIITERPDLFPFINKSNVYKRYTSLLKNRVFDNNLLFIIDQALLGNHQIKEINSCCNGTIFIVISDNYIDLNFDYIFINSLCNLESVYKFIDSVTLEHLTFLVQDFLSNDEILIIDVKNKCLLFY